MVRRPLIKILLILTAVLVVGGVLSWRSIQSGFTPGGGGADERPHRQEADGTLVLRLRLSVWGGGGPVDGRYRNVALLISLADPFGASSPTATTPSSRIPGRLVPGGDASSQSYEFRVPPSSFTSGGRLAYHYEVTLDGQTTQIPGHFDVQVR